MTRNRNNKPKQKNKPKRNNRSNNNASVTTPKPQNGSTVVKNVQVDFDCVPVLIKDHKDSSGGHPHAIMDNIDNCHVSVGFTTKAKKGRNHPNRKMDKSPLNDGKQSYMRRQAIVAPVTEYEKPRNGSMSQNDYDYAKTSAKKAKQKYIAEKNKKKK